MAAPEETTIHNLTGTWTLNFTHSDDPSPALELQGVSWLVRSAIAYAPVTLTITQSEDGTGVTKIESTQSTLGRTVSDVRVLDWEATEQPDHLLFGSLSMRSRWAERSSLDDGFLAGDADVKADGEEVIEVLVTGTEWTNHQVWGFEEIDGQRYHTRRGTVTKGEQRVQVRMVYDWQCQEQ
ncbi:hypothetical protein ASPVEDRAFT_495831 [Aspergillus versicolor CBS 583.65]|uniref:Lipocalin-like domain-containing protein n=1 Tax=Aspergillus versicolor CBS 583.65 TaxID=1036611 RepID=A0A1L9PBV3_ASPVE|nr:uncharacterized protein ASPVEDRAFT_495831 [Aspergillus versicolor CBS 583.65]OJI99010.1 hypothetical protein ASPVEDRAFT_495831 [Aspergillus versicolor CBS 583.65]